MIIRLIYNNVQYNAQVVAINSGLTCHLQAKLPSSELRPSRVQCSVHMQCWRFLWSVFCACAVLAVLVVCGLCSVHVQCWRFLWSVFCACAVLAVLVVCVLRFLTYRVTLFFSKPALDGTLCCCMTVRCSYLC